jgi:hypothetical protein
MKRRHILSLSVATALGLALLPGSALAQQKPLKEQLAGTWTIISNDNTAPDGTKRQLFGPNPKGILVLAANGQYAQIIVHPDRPNFKVNNRLEGTPEENMAAVHGTTASFGSWSFDEASQTLIVRNEGGMFPTRWKRPNAQSPCREMEARPNTRQQVTRHSRELAPPGFGRAGRGSRNLAEHQRPPLGELVL